MSWPPHPYFQESYFGFFPHAAVLITVEMWGRNQIAKIHLSCAHTYVSQRENSSAWLMGIN